MASGVRSIAGKYYQAAEQVRRLFLFVGTNILIDEHAKRSRKLKILLSSRGGIGGHLAKSIKSRLV